MNYPLPENMGFPLPRTIGEMLPDEPLVEPESQRGRYGKRIHVVLNEYTCAGCGKPFTAAPEHRYKMQSQAKGAAKRLQMYCSYSCFRPAEREAQEKFRKDTMGYVPECGGRKSPVEHARARVERFEKKLNELQAIRNDPIAWKALPATRRRSITSLISRHKNNLDEAKEMLKEAELYEP